MELTIVGKKGWSKKISTSNEITRIGRSPINDVQLKSEIVFPFHLQLIYTKRNPSVCKVINFFDEVKISKGKSETILKGKDSIELWDGDEIVIGEYRIIVELPLVGNMIISSDYIQASLKLPDTILPANTAMEGNLKIKNVGNEDSCQFQVEIEGMPEDCFSIEPVPIMFPGAEEIITIKLFHRNFYPEAGPRNVKIKITSPNCYPGESVVLKQGIIIAPVFKHELAFADDSPFSTPSDEDQNLKILKYEEPSQEKAIQAKPTIFETEISEKAVVKTTVKDRDKVIEPPVPQDAEQFNVGKMKEDSDRIIDSDNPAPKSEEKKKFKIEAETIIKSSSTPKVKIISNQFDEFWEDEEN